VIGAAVLGAYLVVAAATLGLSGHHLLPLFEGVGPPMPYQWVNPPAVFASGNVKPQAATTDVSLKGGASAQASAYTTDAQCVVNLNAGAFPSHGNDSSVKVTITPLDAATLGAVPPGVVADGNAYRVLFAYQPSNAPATNLAVPGSIALIAPNPGHVLLYSPDGQTWTTLNSTVVANTSSVFATMDKGGFYLVGARPTAAASGSRGNQLSTLAIVALVVGLAIILTAAPVAVRAVRRRRGGGARGGDDDGPHDPDGNGAAPRPPRRPRPGPPVTPRSGRPPGRPG
jgi:hypothetical protein